MAKRRRKHEVVTHPEDPKQVRCTCGWPHGWGERWVSKRSLTMHRRSENIKGRRVRTLRTLNNGYGKVPKSTEATIGGIFQSKYYNLEFDPCKGCGVALYIRKVFKSDVLLLSEDDE